MSFIGLCGDALYHLAQTDVKSALQRTVYSTKTITRNHCADKNLILSESLFSFLNNDSNHSQTENIDAWVSGEIYNVKELGHSSFSQLLIQHYQLDVLDKLLARVNGVYVALIYDRAKKILHLITDRYGLKPFYYSHIKKSFLIASEVKCFPAFKNFETHINTDAIDCFVQIEHFLGNETWLEGVKVAAPAMVYTYSITDDCLTYRKYWSWAMVKKSSLNLDDAAKLMSNLLDEVNQSRYKMNTNVGVALSGGLDSRAIVAATYPMKPVTYTFGITSSVDVQIAKRVAKIAHLDHHLFDTYTPDWLRTRFMGVWKTDGMLNAYHMHYSHLMKKIASIMDVNLSGFLGDAVLGGTYLERNGKQFLNQRMNATIAQHYYGKYYERCDLKVDDLFFDIDKIDPFLFYNRGRRMIGLGAEEANKTIYQRLPFMDIQLMDLSYSLPDELRANSKVYNNALLMKYPEFFKTIPNANTGVPIVEHVTWQHRLKQEYIHLMRGVKYKLGTASSFIDIHNWIKEPRTASVITQLLDPKKALYREFTSRDFYNEFVVPHLKGARHAKQIMGALTIEIWLQQLLKGNFLED